MAAEAVGLDVGGTKIAALRVDEAGRVLQRSVRRSPAASEEELVAALTRAARDVLTPDVVAVGVGAAGLVDRKGVVAFAPNIAWRMLPLGELVRAALGLPCAVDNDATTAAWGEFRVGAGADVRDMLLVTVGTGIGGGIVHDGRLFRGAHGFAAEIGHIIVQPGGPLCGCGNHGCWEQVASGHAIAREGRAAVLEYPSSALAVMAEGDPSRLEGEHVSRAARDGDAVARGILSEAGRRLGEGIAGLVNVLDPELVVVGGGVVESEETFLTAAGEAFAQTVEGPDFRPGVPLVPARLANDAGAIGAALLAFEELP